MAIEQALETQRTKLLRLLAGWLVIAEWLPVAPFVGELPRWLRSFLGSLVTRAEFAAQSLVFVSARLQAQNGLGEWIGPQPDAFAVDEANGWISDGVPSTGALLRRMKALRALLDDLPRAGRRLWRRCKKRQPSLLRAGAWSRDEELFPVAQNEARWKKSIARRLKRPPDKSHLSVPKPGDLTPSSQPGRKAKACEPPLSVAA